MRNFRKYFPPSTRVQIISSKTESKINVRSTNYDARSVCLGDRRFSPPKVLIGSNDKRQAQIRFGGQKYLFWATLKPQPLIRDPESGDGRPTPTRHASRHRHFASKLTFRLRIVEIPQKNCTHVNLFIAVT